MSLLEVKELKTYFELNKLCVKAVDGVSFHLEGNETLALVGESGSGKSVTALSIMRLLSPPGRIMEGEIMLKQVCLLKMSKKQMEMVRGNRVAMIYQEPMTALNPVISVGEQIREVLIIHKICSKTESKQKAIELMKLVNIPEAELRYRELPGKFSGGMRQRIVIAMAIACNPEILIADEPTTALDVTIQAEIMKLLAELKHKFNMSMLFITHDLGVVAENADRVIVMYCGKIMEEAEVKALFSAPLHPYTMGLMKCIPRVDTVAERLYTIPGSVPYPSQYPEGCRFSNRCENVMDICKREMPDLIEVSEGHKVRCWRHCSN